MKRIAAALFAAGLVMGAHADIVRLDLFGHGYLTDDLYVPFRAYVTLDTVRMKRLEDEGGQTNGWLGAPNMLAFGLRTGNYHCTWRMSEHNVGSGPSVDPLHLSLSGSPLFDEHCNVGIAVTFTAPLDLTLHDTLPQHFIFGGGTMSGSPFWASELTGYVYRVNGYVVAATNRFLVPEPATAVLFGAGLLGLVGMRRRVDSERA